MAAKRARPIRLRLTFNYGSGAIGLKRPKVETITQAVVQDIALQVSDEYWQNIRGELIRKIERDVLQEISAVATQYKRAVIDVGSQMRGIDRTVSGRSAPMADWLGPMPVKVAWQDRKFSYLDRKFREKGQARWFKYDGVLSGTMGRRSTWLGAFGPIKITVTRAGGTSFAPGEVSPQRFFYRSRLGESRITIATVSVSALRNITPAMLPALANGNINVMPDDNRGRGRLLGLLPPALAFRLGGNPEFVPYRHTLEPFLGFLLTRAIPNAVFSRLNKGLEAELSRNGRRGGGGLGEGVTSNSR